MRCLIENRDLSDVESTADEPSDEAIVAQLAAGNHESVVLLLVRYAPRVLGLATSALDRAAAEEIVQDVFVAVWRGASSFDPSRGSFRNWLLTITRNRIANELRRRGRRPDTRGTEDATGWTALSDPGPGPDDAVWHDFRRQTLRAAVESLPPKQRQALSLAFFEELTHEQVAAALDVPLGTAKTRIRSAIETLRGQLTPMRASLLIGLLLLAGRILAGAPPVGPSRPGTARPVARDDQRRRAGSPWSRSPALIPRPTARIAGDRVRRWP